MVRREMEVFTVDSLPLGFRFRPTDVELVNHYLKGKISGRIKSEVEVIPEIDVCKCEPWDLPAKALVKSSDEWFFFSPKDRKYPNSSRSNRATQAGYWKATGKDRMIRTKARETAIIGTKKTLVFYQGRAPKGVRTLWIMHEYRTTEPQFDSGGQGGFVLYRLFKKDGERNPVSDADDCMERNVDDTQSSALSSASTMHSLGGMHNIEDAAMEPVTPLDQKPPLCDSQENIQLLPLCSDEQLSGASELFPDKNNFIRNNLQIQEESHFTGTVESPSDGVDFSLEDFTRFVVPELEEFASDGFHINSLMLPQMGHELYDGVEKQNLEDDSITEFLDGILCDPEECSPDVSNACSSLAPYYSYSPAETFTIWDSTTCISGDNKDMTADVIEVLGEQSKPPVCSRSVLQKSNAAPVRQHTSQFSLLQNQNLGHNVSSVETTKSTHQESVNIENIDNARIHIIPRRNLLASNYPSEEKGSSTNRIRLQKSIHNVSASKTDHISTINDDIVRSVIREVPEIVEHLEENTEFDLDSNINAKDPPRGNAIFTVKASSTEFGDDPKSTGLRSRWAHKDEISKKTSDRSFKALAITSGSYSTIRIILILSALLLFLCLGLSWCLSS
ncbi:uncharacterized protein LOC122045895 isoform X2 [Zingiber officinale]|uniref:NAC domain-containing protein n=1 Tax=Zingiber officinale TaxID=94328 RepID=A0A8J5HCQ0_ZINOF|nr:uncharacterized protein LOC122045895 isoform X2 [Zingiber officinale]KAG6524318.1 hypothetical protein ZIOFF_014224 [Zingiber officinale]